MPIFVLDLLGTWSDKAEPKEAPRPGRPIRVVTLLRLVPRRTGPRPPGGWPRSIRRRSARSPGSFRGDPRPRRGSLTPPGLGIERASGSKTCAEPSFQSARAETVGHGEIGGD